MHEIEAPCPHHAKPEIRQKQLRVFICLLIGAAMDGMYAARHSTRGGERGK